MKNRILEKKSSQLADRVDSYSPKIEFLCTSHGPQSRVILKGLETQHLILACGCAFDLGMEENPPFDGNLHDGSFTYQEAQEAFVFSNAIEVPAEEYFKRLATIGNGVPDVENYAPLDRRLLEGGSREI